MEVYQDLLRQLEEEKESSDFWFQEAGFKSIELHNIQENVIYFIRAVANDPHGAVQSFIKRYKYLDDTREHNQ